MKNVISIDFITGDKSDLVSSMDDGTNTLFLEIKSDISKNPTLQIDGMSVSITSSDYSYEVTNLTGNGNITFRIVDNERNGAYSTISKVASIDGNLTLNQVSDYSYSLSVYVPSTGVQVVDNLDSHSTTSALSANQGRELDQKIVNIINFMAVTRGKVTEDGYVSWFKFGRIVIAWFLNVIPNSNPFKYKAPPPIDVTYNTFASVDLTTHSIFGIGLDGTVILAVGDGTKQYTGEIIYISK